MSDALLIRPIAPTDFSRWLPLWDSYNAFYGRLGATALADEITRMTWGRFFESDEPVHALVAEQNAQLVGFAHYLFHRSTIQIGLTCYLQDLFTSETARRKGIGRALIEGVYGQARIAGSKDVYWQTHETNLTAMRLYNNVAERSGFIVYEKAL